jgi:hypothetical protein
VGRTLSRPDAGMLHMHREKLAKITDGQRRCLPRPEQCKRANGNGSQLPRLGALVSACSRASGRGASLGYTTQR